MRSIPLWQNWDTLGKHTLDLNVSGNMPATLLTFHETAARKNSSRKAFAKVESNQSLVTFSFFPWCVHNSGLESFGSP